LQDTFERAFRSLDRYHSGTSAAAWMQTIMYRLAIDESRHVRRDRRLRTEYERHRALLEAAVGEDEPKNAAPGPGSLGDVLAMAERLAEPYRSTFVLRTVERLSYREISQRTGQPIGTVGRRLHQARQQLQEQAGERGVG
jgi:RNA polymerase sigma factor (sigma-70 family)